MRGHYKITKLLKTKGGSVTKQDFGGNTALHLVLKSAECSYAMVKFLLEAGSDPCQVDNVRHIKLSIHELYASVIAYSYLSFYSHRCVFFVISCVCANIDTIGSMPKPRIA